MVLVWLVSMRDWHEWLMALAMKQDHLQGTLGISTAAMAHEVILSTPRCQISPYFVFSKSFSALRLAFKTSSLGLSLE